MFGWIDWRDDYLGIFSAVIFPVLNIIIEFVMISVVDDMIDHYLLERAVALPPMNGIH